MSCLVGTLDSDLCFCLGDVGVEEEDVMLLMMFLALPDLFGSSWGSSDYPAA